MKEIMINTLCGEMKGEETSDHIQHFFGIRYAKAARWHYPEEVRAWDGIYDATHFGDACIQKRTFQKETTENFYYKEFRENETYTYSEDCLNLNIWKPSSCEYAPVMLFIHGGAFQGGCGNEKHMDGTEYAKRGIIFITCNYRLGALGFAALPQLKERDGYAGNYGLYDQLTAIEWIYHNIEQFGGDRENITLMGQSAGAMSIFQLCASPIANRYIKKAIMTSGGGLSSQFSNLVPVKDAYSFWTEVVSSLGQELSDWENVPEEELLNSLMLQASKSRETFQYFTPMIDGRLVQYNMDEIASGDVHAEIPYLMGCTKDDMCADVIYQMATEWTMLQSEKNMVPSYCFQFRRNLPGDGKGAWHSSEMWYTMGRLDRSWRPMQEWDRCLSDVMIDYFSNFAKKGNPNSCGLKEWSPTTVQQPQIMLFEDDNYGMNNGRNKDINEGMCNDMHE